MTENNTTSKYVFEIAAWKRTLDYIQFENVQMKNRVAEIARVQGDSQALQKMESYNNQFLNKDTAIAFLRRDIKKLEENHLSVDQTVAVHKALRTDMEKMEREFCTLKYNFDEYIQTFIMN